MKIEKYKKKRKIKKKEITKIKKIKKIKKGNIINKKYKIFILIIFLNILITYNNNNKILNKYLNNEIINNDTKEYINNNNTENDIKVCICTLGKQENRYMREYLSHYEKYGIDKIYIYDNNDINGERFEEVINDYISKGFVEILDWRGKLFIVHKMMKDCYRRNYKKYDWLMFYELDEFIHLSNYTNIKPFLKQSKFENCQSVCLNLICHTDNNKLYYENKSLSERFPEIVPIAKHAGNLLEVKTIIRGNISYIGNVHLHILSHDVINCNGYGNKNKFYRHYSTEPDYSNYYIDHYYSKSTEEFINKLNRGDAFSTSTEYYLMRVEKYFNQSKLTKEKVDMIEKATRLNLSKFREKLLYENNK